MIDPSEILFVGYGASPICWYRCALPATFMGADWCGVQGHPPDVQFVTGIVKGETRPPVFEDYRVVIVQYAQGNDWLRFIRKLQDRGVIVLYEIDDYLHGVSKIKGHDFGNWFTKKRLARYELCMRVCDGMICSTQYLGQRYKKFNARTYVCENGLDVSRYDLTIPERSTVNIGWAGATGHAGPLGEWLQGAVIPIMEEDDNVCFVSVGDQSAAAIVAKRFGEERAIGTPFTFLETYPAAMTMLDVALASAGPQAWYRAKSDLRFLESGALGIPLVADPVVYDSINHGVTGFHADDPSAARAIITELVADQELRRDVGGAAHDYVHGQRNAAVAALGWLDVCRAAAGDYESPRLLER